MKTHTINRRIRRALNFKRRWLVAEHLRRAGDPTGGRIMNLLIRRWLSEARRWA